MDRRRKLNPSLLIHKAGLHLEKGPCRQEEVRKPGHLRGQVVHYEKEFEFGNRLLQSIPVRERPEGIGLDEDQSLRLPFLDGFNQIHEGAVLGGEKGGPEGVRSWHQVKESGPALCSMEQKGAICRQVRGRLPDDGRPADNDRMAALFQPFNDLDEPVV